MSNGERQGRRMEVGVVLPIGEEDDLTAASGRRAPRFAEIRALAQQIEAAGFDSVWIYDHLLFRFPDTPASGTWEAWTLMTAVAAVTQRVKIGAIVLCVPFRNPAVLAKMATTLDEVSDGRLILGLGAGWHQPEFDAFGVPFDHLASRFEEALQIICPLLREGYVDFQGRYYRAPNCELRPRGPRPAGPPILVAAGKPRMLELTARYADAWNTAWLGTPEPLAARRAALEAACRAVERDPSTLEITVGVETAYYGAGEEPEHTGPQQRPLSGTPEEVAAGLRAFEHAGVGQAICSLNRVDRESVAWLAAALERLRA